MSFSNVFIGNTANDGTGDALRTAFGIINQNFANLAAINNTANVVIYASGNANVTATYNPGVASVAGRTGNVSLTVNDIIGAASIGYVNAMQANTAAIAANLAANLSTASVDANVAAANIEIGKLRSNITAANLAITNLESNASTQSTAINLINANITAANSSISGINSSITTLTANSSVQAQLINVINANVLAANAAIAAIGDVSSINANVVAANVAIINLQSNSSVQAAQINNLSANITAGNLVSVNGINSVNANVTAANLAIVSLQSNAAGQAVGINSLIANITASNVEIASLRANAGAQGTLINSINANVAAANLTIAALQSNAGSQQTEIINLTANTASQESAIAALRANVTAANAAIAAIDLAPINANVTAANAAVTALQSNAATQAVAIDSLRANITASNVEVASLRANAGAQGALIIALQSNAGIQAALLDTLTGNAATQSTVLDTLVANASTQANSLTALLANAASQESSLTVLVSNAATQSGLINQVNANIAAANSAIAAQTVEVNSLRANITASNVEVVSLRANAGAQATLINIINSNVAAANASTSTNINTIQANVGSYQIFANANAAAQAGSLNTLNNNVNVLFDLITLGNAAFANTANVVSGATFIGNVQVPYLTVTNIADINEYIKVGSEHDTGTVFDNLAAIFWGNSSLGGQKYYQINLQNTDPEGSGDIVVTADDGTDGTNYIAIGIGGSQYNDPNYPYAYPHDGYVYLTGGNLYLQSNGAAVYFGAGVNGMSSNMALAPDGNLYLTSANIVFADNTRQTTAYNHNAINANIGVVYNLFTLGNLEFGNINANVLAANIEISNLQSNIIATNVALSDLSNLVANSGGAFGNANVALYLADNTVSVGNLLTANGIYWSQNGAAYTSESNYGNTEVAAYLLTSNANVGNLTTIGTITSSGNITTLGAISSGDTITASGQKSRVRSHWDTFTDLENEVDANTWHGMIAHAHDQGRIYFAHAGSWNGVANQTEVNTITANLGAYQIYANTRFDTITYGNTNVKSYLGKFNGNIVPSANLVYSLGSFTNRWKDVYIGANTVYLGDATISSDGFNIVTSGGIQATAVDPTLIGFRSGDDVFTTYNAPAATYGPFNVSQGPNVGWRINYLDGKGNGTTANIFPRFNESGYLTSLELVAEQGNQQPLAGLNANIWLYSEYLFLPDISVGNLSLRESPYATSANVFYTSDLYIDPNNLYFTQGTPAWVSDPGWSANSIGSDFETAPTITANYTDANVTVSISYRVHSPSPAFNYIWTYDGEPTITGNIDTTYLYGAIVQEPSPYPQGIGGFGYYAYPYIGFRIDPDNPTQLIRVTNWETDGGYYTVKSGNINLTAPSPWIELKLDNFVYYKMPFTTEIVRKTVANTGVNLSGNTITVGNLTLSSNGNIYSPAGSITTGDLTAGNIIVSLGNISGNMSYTMANYQHWTSNVSTVGEALDQLAARIWAIENP